ncbi:carbon-nitrogen family hydrolase [Sporosarcina sp. resist]|uniref:carbon-nitrogen family hydrolase n=1 Tax=Sporosarcina sp. resist TaxID=2762563 RepID=UPI00164E6CAC|nr:carbon-nitrogen family hydrolase [Sporosarcina sp. resist]QNK86108.1 carbon-nitrogen family hydrolase [Sporosarcina sp. resist]
MKYAIYQMEIVAGKPSENRRKVMEWVEKTMESTSPDILVLPEMWTTGYTLSILDEVAEETGQDTIPFLTEISKRFNVNIIGGSVANKKNGCIYNSSFVVNRLGELVYEYDKIHLVPMLDEHLYLEGGKKKVSIFELDGIKMGLIICYDLRFPELSRELALKGAEVLHVVAEWPTVRKEHWHTLQKARAIENQMFVVSCNCVGTYNNVEYAGMSMIIDPWGSELSIGQEQSEETIVNDLALELTAKVRKNVPVFSSRVPELY